MNRTIETRMSLVAVLVLGISACGRAEQAAPAGDAHGDMPMGGMPEMEEMHGMEGMHMDPAMMRRHAEELEAVSARLRPHIQEMRRLSAQQQYERMGAHVNEVSSFLGLVNRQMREMDMGMGMGDHEMGRMMGMTGEEHRRMMDGFAELRADLEQLQTAAPDDVRERMPAHLDRLERALELTEHSARHMAAM